MRGGLGKPAIGEQAGELAADAAEVNPFRGAHRLAGAPGVKAPQIDPLTEALREITRGQHGLDEFQHFELNAPRLGHVALEEAVIEFHHGFGCHAAGGDGAAIGTHEQGWQQDFLTADQTGEIRPLRFDFVEAVIQ